MKRFASMLLALALTLSCCAGITYAATGGVNSPMESLTIAKTTAYSYTGDNTGEVDFEYSITATGSASMLGASSIVVHKPDGTTETIKGNIANGMVSSGSVHSGTYTYEGISGQPYYAEITLFAMKGAVIDSRTITTISSTAC